MYSEECLYQTGSTVDFPQVTLAGVDLEHVSICLVDDFC